MAPTKLTDVLWIIDHSSLPEDRKAKYKTLLYQLHGNLKTPTPNDIVSSKLLASIPSTHDASNLPFIFLSFLLGKYNGRLPVFDLFKCYFRLWHYLPEKIKSGHEQSQLVEQTTRQLMASYGDLPSLLPRSERQALVDARSRKALTHLAIVEFIEQFRLPIPGNTNPKPVVVLALPNGSIMGLACLAVAAYYTAVPVSITGGQEQFRIDVQLSQSKIILAMRSDRERLGLNESWILDSGTQVILLDQKSDLTFETSNPDSKMTTKRWARSRNGASDIAFILFTSGTSGTKKRVPITLHTVISGVSCVVDSWGLSSTDVCLNMMPLNHVGGIIRNLFAPILSGGSTILCEAFDPNLFWDLLEEGRSTWYYASPSMHLSILAERSDRPNGLSNRPLRLVCNAAGGLLPSLARDLRDVFGCTVLPSYGMTECMPISTPPLDYKLDRIGTSGKSCGPEIAILDENDNDKEAYQIGRICVRGGPTFTGYLTTNDSIKDKTFNQNGWFDTGDMGYLDREKYLYVTGRSKEVINRGGELISPFEVEDAIMTASQKAGSPIFDQISEVLAFSAPHEILQEVVGVAVVISVGKLRPDLRQLQLAVKTSLHPSKWPVVVVYMDALPRNNNKIIRINLGERLELSPIFDGMTLAGRHFEAKCPAPDSPLRLKIPKANCLIDCHLVLKAINLVLAGGLDAHVSVNNRDGFSEVILAPNFDSPKPQNPQDALTDLQQALRMSLDGYLVPSNFVCMDTPFHIDEFGLIDEKALQRDLQAVRSSQATTLLATEQKIREIFAKILCCSVDEISEKSDFFEMGGDSLNAGKFLSELRREMKVSLPVGTFFLASKVQDVAYAVEMLHLQNKKVDSELPSSRVLPGCSKTYSSTNPVLLAIQLLPILLLYPLKVGFRWTMLMYSLSVLSEFWSNPNIAARFLSLIAAMAISRVATNMASPIIGIAIKWIIIGRYKEGLFPMWGPYHTRWWIVQKTLLIFGKGVFSQFDFTRVLYYRLLGAKIGKGVKIEKGVVLGEYDLLDIGDNVQLDPCVCRPFAVEQNTSMYLGKVILRKNSSVGSKSHVAAGSIVPEGKCIGPSSSSHEMEETDADPSLSRSQAPKCHPAVQAFIIVPVKLIVSFIISLPWIGGLVGIVKDQPRVSLDVLKSIVIWWASAERIGFHYLARVLNRSVRPFVWLALVVCIKRLMDRTIGKTRPLPTKQTSHLERFRLSLLESLIPHGNIHRITSLFGSHYEFTSLALRALGAKVGSRVYWPGTGPSIEDFDLLEVGDDVVFGSRSQIFNSDGKGSDFVRIGSGVMVADRVTLLPGTTVGDRVVLGSGALTERNKHYPADTIWIGNKRGRAICLSTTEKSSKGDKPNAFIDDKLTAITDDGSSSGSSTCGTRQSSITEDGGNESSRTSITEISTSSPFGKAFYDHKANYYVIGLFGIFLYSTITKIFVELYWNTTTVSAVQLLATLMRRRPEIFAIRWYRPLLVYAFSVSFISFITGVLTVFALGIVISAKWALLGRRQPGQFDWDKSSYCQRWQIFLTIEMIRRKCFGGYGIIGMLTGTHYAVMYFRALGATIGKDCALFAGGRPNLLFTEPDLLELGDRVAIDDASLVAHINSRGNFRLNRLTVGSGSVLRSGSRLLSGASMGKDSCLLEHTLIMAGDHADEGMTFQGWPAEVFSRDRAPLAVAQ